MKTYSFITILLLLSNHLFSQNFEALMKSRNNNYFEVLSDFKQDSLIQEKADKHDLKEFGRWEAFWRTRIDSEGNISRMQKEILNFNDKVMNESKSLNSKSGINFYLECLGPNNSIVPYGYTSYFRLAGRGLISSIWVDPVDSDHIIIGANNGGLWETSNGGTNWICITDNTNYFIGGIADFVVHPDYNDLIYILSRVRVANGSRLMESGQYNTGLFMSIDGGGSWVSTPFPVLPLGEYFKKIIKAPDYVLGYYVLTTDGVYKTLDGGVQWDELDLEPDTSLNYFMNIVCNPDNPSTIYVSGKNELHRSTDGGVNWTNIRNMSDPNYSDAYIDIAVDPQNEDHLYANYFSQSNNTKKYKIEKSTNCGSSWLSFNTQDLTARAHVMINKIAPNGDFYSGGIELNRKAASGTSFYEISEHLGDDLVHDDIRDIYFPNSLNSAFIIIATDGGLYKTVDYGSNWIEINGDLVNNEFYSAAVTPQDPDIILGGLHDNHTYMRNAEGNWVDVSGGGDGGSCLISPTNPNTYYYTINHSF